MLYIVSCILPIFALIAIGYIARQRFLPVQEFWTGSEKITYYLLFPALLINSLTTANLDTDLYRFILPLVLATLLISFSLIIMQKIKPINRPRFTSYFQGAIRYNSYIFIGITSALYGTESLAIVAVIISYMIVLTNVLSVTVLSIYASETKPNVTSFLKSIIKNPLVLSSFIGIVLNKVSFLYPHIIGTLFGFLGDAALPLSLMCVGAGLKFSQLRKHINSIVLVNGAKLILLPCISLLFLNLFKVPGGMIKNIALLYAAVPCAGNAYILALQMKGDHETMAAIISTSTLLSIITIPFISMLL